MAHWPRTGASVLVIQDHTVLLAKRGKDPFKGYWSLPGGSQEAGETLLECALRELREETAIVAELAEFITVRDRINRHEDGTLSHHFVLATYLVRDFSGQPVAGDDAEEIGWFEPSQFDQVRLTPDTSEFVIATLNRYA
ncbi:MAG: NUDIX hydrolase [Pseudomonadota bacterium]